MLALMSRLFARPTHTKEHLMVQHSTNGHHEAIKEAVASFLKGLQYAPPDSDIERQRFLVKALLSEFSEYNQNAWFEEMCHQASAMAELSYHRHPVDVQLQIARFTWYMLYIDDLCHKFPDSLQKFQQSVLLSDSHGDHPVLVNFRKHLSDMYKFWDFMPANGITSSALEFINGCALEEMPEISNMTLSVNARSWPYFLRTRTGVASAYAFMIFPRYTNPDLSDFIQAIGDISLFIDLTNDVLSFYKEELAGETKNYVHNMAYVNEKPVLDVLDDILRQALDAGTRISMVLRDTNLRKQWSTFLNGYVAFHMTQRRYRLVELGL